MTNFALIVLLVITSGTLFALNRTNQTLRCIMATQSEIATQLNAVQAVLVHVASETTTLLARIEELLALLADGGVVTPELQAAADAVATQAHVVDDLVADPVPPPAP